MPNQFDIDRLVATRYAFEIIEDNEWEALAGLTRFENHYRPLVYRATPNDCWYISGEGLWFVKYDPELPTGVAWTAEWNVRFRNNHQAVRAATGFMHITSRNLLEKFGFYTEDWVQN